MVANKSDIDRMGWDYIVEFMSLPEHRADDLHRARPEFKVQVKATDGNARKLSIPLSVIRHLAIDPLPAFIVFLEFGGANLPQNIFVVHVGKDVIYRALSGVRKALDKSPDDNLRKKSILIKYNEEHVLEEVDGNRLRERFEKYIGESFEDYHSWKQSYLKEVGYDDGAGQISFTTCGECNLQRLVEASVGLDTEVPVVSVTGFQKRFGIQDKTPFLSSKEGSLKVLKAEPSAVGELRFREGKLSIGHGFRVELFGSVLNPMVPETMARVRMQGDWFEIVMNPFTGAAKFNFSVDRQVRSAIGEVKARLEVLRLLTSGSDEVNWRLSLPDGRELGGPVGSTASDFEFSEELDCLRCVWRLISFFEVTEDVAVSLDELLIGRDGICSFATLVLDDAPAMVVEFSLEEGDEEVGDQAVLVDFFEAAVGSHVFGAICSFFGGPVMHEKGVYSFCSENVRIEKKIFARRDGSVSIEELRGAINEAAEPYVSDFMVVKGGLAG
ncbi:hypothetical protein [Thioalkalivibrio sp. ALE16]|uniref:hypothetical protein n=1 Tax=Thioalkalivibrio sp. ALE16 TaxID=1158172 RepID=UPI0012DDF287|nr:hypothetical protein [Thioalkalivibrio sp. ALE16]